MNTPQRWVKFVGTDGNVTTSGDDAADNQEGSGARVDGFLNVDTKQVEFIVDYNMMTCAPKPSCKNRQEPYRPL